MDRRNFIKSGAAFSGLSVFGSFEEVLAQTTGPIKIGLMAPLTGVLAAGGKEIVEGFTMYWESIGKKVAGRDIQIFIEDDASNPDIALQKARKLTEQNQVDFLVGNLLANTGLAVAEYAKTSGIPYFIPVIAADDLTQRARIPNVIRVAGYTASQTSHPLGDYAYKTLGYRKIVTISQDYTFGHEQCGGLVQVFTELGGQVLNQFWNPLNTQDFSPYFAQIQALKPDAVFVMETGADGLRFLQQWTNFGLKGKIPLLCAQNTTDQSVIRSLNSGEADGLISAAHFAEGAPNVQTQKFVAEYLIAHNHFPSIYGFSHYVAAVWIAKAITKVGGDISNRPKFLDSIRSIVLEDSPLGRPVKLDTYGNPIYDVFIRKVTKRSDGKYWNVPIETYPSVSQFWKYKPEEYLKQAPYSRTFQGIKKI